MKRDTASFIIVLSLILVFILVVIGVFYATGILNKVFQSTIEGFTQYTAKPSCSGESCKMPGDNLIYSSIVEINTGKNLFKFESIVKDIITKKECLSEPSFCSGNMRSLNVQKTYIDSNGCQHYSYDTRTIDKFETSYKSNVCTSTANVARWNFFYDNGCQFQPAISGQQPRVCSWLENSITDYGGSIEKTTDSSGIIYRGCFQEIKVYKNNQLIDTFTSEKSNNYKKAVTYFDDGGICEGICYGQKSGIAIDSSQTSWFYADKCSAFQNNYDFVFSNDSFLIEISTPKSNYTQGEDILLNVKVKNNLNILVSGILEINYEVPTIIGKATKLETQNVTINLGENTYQYRIPTSKPVDLLRVKPKLSIKYPTSKLSGLNYNFQKTSLYPINAFDSFIVGTTEEDWSEIQITSLAEYYKGKLDLTEAELKSLNLSLTEKLKLIEQYKGNLQDQSSLIDSLNFSIQEKAQIIDSLNLNLKDQAELINKLTLTSQEQASIINDLKLTTTQQAQLINQMQLEVTKQSEIINNLNLTISQQANLINQLNLNLQDKIKLVSSLQSENEKQAELIKQMKLSFSDQAYIIDGLNKEIEDDAEIIKEMGLSNTDQAQLINNLQLSNKELGELVYNFGLTIKQDKELIEKLNKTLKEKGEIISQLNLNLEQEAELIKQYTSELDEQAKIISGLDLSLEQEKELVSKLYSELNKQNELLTKISQEKLKNDEEIKLSFWDKYKTYIVVGTLIFMFLIVIIIFIIYIFKYLEF